MITILRTAVGSPVAPFLLKNLTNNLDCRIIGVDIDELACGFKFCHKSYVVPKVNDEQYLPELFKICEEEEVDIFWPDLDEELLLMASHKAEFEKRGVILMLSDQETLAVCTNKLKTFDFFKSEGIPTPLTSVKVSNPETMFTYPFIIKPIHGRGSEGVHQIKNRIDYQYYSSFMVDFIIQEMLEGKEYTIDTLSDANGNFEYASIRERVSTDSGISVKGRTVDNPKIINYVKRACQALRIKGPACLQCFESEKGDIKFIEINPRIAGTVAISVLAGAPFILDSINAFTNKGIAGIKDYKVGLYASRYWSEVVFD